VLDDLFSLLLKSTNETLAAAIVVVSASMLLYNLSRNLRNRVARTSGAVLACVTAAYLCDVFISLGPTLHTYEAVLRLQWVGIAFIPAAIFHLSDALLATTGLPSRGRRRRITRILYLISSAFLISAAFTDILVQPVYHQVGVSLRPGPLFWLYVLYFVLATSIAFYNVQRARRRCLTRSTQRRMGYLQIAMLTPPLGIFPYSLLFSIGEQSSVAALLLVNVANLVVILMLLFLSYPLSFFGSRVPDRVVKTELLRFMLRGPATGLLALAVIIFLTPATRVLGFAGDEFMPFAVVSVVLIWQWSVALGLPWLEKRLIYFNEDDDQLEKLQNLSDRLLTRSDLLQLIEAILEASCDYLRVNAAFIVSFSDHAPELIKSIGSVGLTPEILREEVENLSQLPPSDPQSGHLLLQSWRSFWIIPLYSRRALTAEQRGTLIGFMGIEARSQTTDLTPDDEHMLLTFVRRAARTLDDMLLQTEIYAALEGLLPQFKTTRLQAAETEYRPGREPIKDSNGLPDREQVIDQVWAALRHYWGGAGLTSSRLQEMQVVRSALPDNENNPTRALRAVLQKAIDKQRPEGQRKMPSPEWTIYNILQLRFIERVKVRDSAYRLALSEPDLYRKQRVAVEAVADTLLEMEQQALDRADGQSSGGG
jgi:hypothetical protein